MEQATVGVTGRVESVSKDGKLINCFQIGETVVNWLRIHPGSLITIPWNNALYIRRQNSSLRIQLFGHTDVGAKAPSVADFFALVLNWISSDFQT